MMKSKVTLRIKRLFMVVCMGFALQSCVTDQHKPIAQSPNVTDIAVEQVSAMPIPDPADKIAKDIYLIGPYDRLTIKVFGVEELTAEKILVDGSGNVTFPLIGNINVVGKSSAAIATEIENRLRPNYILDPHVSVNIEESDYQFVTVDGEVRRPGQYPVRGTMSLIRAIAMAEGTTQYTQLDDVVVFRTAQNKKYAALYNLEAIRRGNYDDPDIYPNDVIVVGNSRSRRFFQDMLTFLPLLTTPLYIIFR